MPPIIGITSSKEEAASPYAACIEDAGGASRLLSCAGPLDVDETLDPLQGLLLTGGADVEPSYYGAQADPAAHVRTAPVRDAAELPLIKAALQRNIPILGICRGMQAMNVALGGSLLQDLPGHRSAEGEPPVTHQVFIPPGVRLTAILGVGGFMKVNSYHHQGVKWAQKAPGLMVGAYSLKDGLIEALESPQHRWVVGVQWHPERRDEVPKVFRNLFLRFVEASANR